MLRLVFFIVVSIPIIFFSWPSFRNRHSHGFYRFFSLEGLLVIVISNADHWFENPTATNQIVSWILLCCSLLLAVHGFYLLHVIGRPQGNFENTTRLVIVGAYKYIRHPLYGSLVFLTWGVFCKDLTLLGVLLTAITSVFLFATAKAEESENLTKFGNEYADYMGSTKMFIPFVF
jgi:protein-S-isoprenylcysteine O-methyltransferase Ste14